MLCVVFLTCDSCFAVPLQLEPFASRLPLTCGNQAGVSKYLRQWLEGFTGGDDGDEPYSGATYSGGKELFGSGHGVVWFYPTEAAKVSASL